MLIETLSVFPELFEPYLSTSIIGRARAAQLFDFVAYDLRDWTHDRHRTVDDAPFGGGAGMLMKPEPIFEAIEALSQSPHEARPYVVFMSPAGRPFTQQIAADLASKERILFVCGRYEGMDERVYTLADEIISIGDYVLTGGELPALVVIDALVRLVPEALGAADATLDESFAQGQSISHMRVEVPSPTAGGLLEYAQYTRPASFRGMDVPEVLLSGNHAQIASWRRLCAIERTCARRPDLIEHAELSDTERAFAKTCMHTHTLEGAD